MHEHQAALAWPHGLANVRRTFGDIRPHIVRDPKTGLLSALGWAPKLTTIQLHYEF
jgi:hypothetical protein